MVRTGRARKVAYVRYLVPVVDGAPSWPESRIEELGTVTAPAGELVLIDFGCLRLWSGESEPTLDPDVVGDEVAATANSAVDLEILGDSPVAAGRATLLAAVAGRYVFDIPASRVDEMRDLVASRARQDGFSVRVEPIARMPHRTRVARLLDDSPDGAEVLYGGPLAVAVRGLPADRPLPVRGVRMPEDGSERTRWHSIWVEADERVPARTEEIGYVLVDEARLAFAAPDALTAWRTDSPADGLVDLAFWGRDAPTLVERTGAGTLDDGTHGWTDLPVQEAVDRASGLYRAKKSEGLRFALDVRPHDDHYRLLSLARTAPTESASVEIGGSVVCGFFTSWGDGAFPVRRDLADDGTLCRLRVEVGAPEIVERQRKLDDRWFGELSLAALVTARVARGDAQVRWMYRQEPANPGDSGWRVFAGDETDSEANDPENVVIVPLRDLTAADADLESLLRTPAPCAFERQHDGGFTAVEYQPPQDLRGAYRCDAGTPAAWRQPSAPPVRRRHAPSRCARYSATRNRDDHSIWTGTRCPMRWPCRRSADPAHRKCRTGSRPSPGRRRRRTTPPC